MTTTEYRAAIKALDLSQVGAARLFGVAPRTSRRWAMGEQPIPRAAAMCLRMMLKHGVTAAEAQSMADGK